MPSCLQFPVISVAVDAVSRLNGDDDCRGLWQVFHQCRDALEDGAGARLENMTWRLWYREISIGADSPLSLKTRGAVASRPPLPETLDFSSESETSDYSHSSDSLPTSSHADDTEACCDVTVPSEFIQPQLAAHGTQPHSNHVAASPTDGRAAQSPHLGVAFSQPNLSFARPVLQPEHRANSAPSCARLSHQPHSNAGKIVSQLIPAKLSLSVGGCTAVTQRTSSATLEGSSAYPTPTEAVSATLSHFSAGPPAAPVVVLPSTPPTSSSAICPMVVVVNPTPHPTPPPTPRLDQSPDAFSESPSLSLLPPAAPSATPFTRTPGVNQSSSPGGDPDNEADRRSRARFFLTREPGSPEQSPDSEASTPGSSALSGAPVSARDSGSSRSAGIPMRLVEEAGGFGMAASSASSNFNHGSVASSVRGRARRAKEPMRHHVGRVAAAHKPAFPHRPSQQKAARPAAGLAGGSTTAVVPPAAVMRNERDVTLHPRPTAVKEHAAGAMLQRNLDPVNLQVQRPVALRPPAAPRPMSPRTGIFHALLAPATRKVELTSSEFDSDSEGEDSSWASDDDSPEPEPAPPEPEPEPEPESDDIALKAAVEAKRQRELIVKRDTGSFQNLDRLPRVPSLLTSMFRPDIAKFPLNHPHRHSLSAQELLGPRVVRPSPQPLPGSPIVSHSKSSAVVPVAQQVTAQGVNGRRGYVPRGRPEEEMEDSEEDDPSDTVQVSKSVVQQRLEALAGTSRRRAHPPPHAPAGPVAGPSTQPATAAAAATPTYAHPYAIPPPPPLSAQATRRAMLANEMSESLRRNLLWERYVTKLSHGIIGKNGKQDVSGGRFRPLAPPALTSGDQQPPGPHRLEPDAPVVDRAERKRKAIARNRSFQEDFHTTGW